MMVQSPPRVVFWFKVYAGILLWVYIACTALGLALLQFPELFIDPTAGSDSGIPKDAVEAYIQGLIYSIVGGVLFCAFALSFVLGRGTVAWTYNLVLICIGLTSCCCLPTNIPLLIFWIRRDCRQWYLGHKTAEWEVPE